ncbi:SUVZ12G1885 [Saccharomyces uvarum]|uniref:SUVZ12G1885 protein n=1 Tax=Saccharomyces uvarum TaxID=230603 RepID=A0ABN8WGW5_SACUV|nr:SUVZ12G1885 [Saccharomyces uvarum]
MTVESQQLRKYITLYNREVEEFHGGAAAGRPREFHPSEVHVKSTHEKASARDSGVETSLGVEWDSEEKETFFWCLSRYSIHRVEEWRPLLPRKSAMEILGYYKLLRRASARANSRKAGDGGSAPIAYEMSSGWVALETKLSEAAGEAAAEAPATEEGDAEGLLIDYDSWRRRWEAIYSHSRIAEIRPLPRHALPVSRGAAEALERSVRRYTRVLLWCTALAGMASRSVVAAGADASVGRGHRSLPTVVTRRQVERALCTEAQARDLHVLPRCVALTLRKWELDYPREGKLFRTREMARLFLQSQLSRRDPPPPPRHHDQVPDQIDDTASESGSEPERDEIDDVDLIRSALHENRLLKWLSK